MKNLILSLLVLTLVYSCEKNNTPPAPPVYLIASASFEVDSVVYNVDTNDVAGSITSFNDLQITLPANDSESVSLWVYEATGTGDYTLKNSSAIRQHKGQWNNSYGSTSCDSTNNPGFTEGKITITKWDKAGKRVSGTFEFDACFSTFSKNIRKGKFENIPVWVQ